MLGFCPRLRLSGKYPRIQIDNVHDNAINVRPSKRAPMQQNL